MPENPFTLAVRATVTVTDLDALVRQVDELVALSPEFEPIEDGTYWDGWEDREGTGYLFQGDAVWLDDDERAMVDLGMSLSHLRTRGVSVEFDASVDPRPLRPGSDAARYSVELTVNAARVTEACVASAWLGPVTSASPLVVGARCAVALLESVAGCDVRVTSAVARPARPLPTTDLERLVVRRGGETYETDSDGRLVGPIPDEPTTTDLRLPLRLDGPTARNFVHFAHPIPISRGFRRAWVALNAPGWTGNDLFDALRAAGLVDRSGPMPKLVDGVRWVDIEPSGRCSRVEFDPVGLRRRQASR